MNIEHISVSRYDLWKECKCKYRFRYHLKTPSPIEEPYYFFYGSLVHRFAEEYIKAKGEKTLNEISNQILKEEKISLPGDYKARLPGHLRSIDSLTKKIGFDGELELPFNLDLDPPNEKMVAGVIDRLIFKNDKRFIIDYKTTKPGKWRKDQSTIKKDLQLQVYAWAVHQIYKIDYDKIRGALYYLEGGSLIPTKFNAGSIYKVIEELTHTYDEIKSFDPNLVIGTTGDHCGRCNYRSVCCFYKLKGRK